jgi:hypothetical protein
MQETVTEALTCRALLSSKRFELAKRYVSILGD